MHIFMSGIGGSGMSSMAIMAHQAGYKVTGSDSNDGPYIKYLREHGITDIHIGQSTEAIAEAHAHNPIDWFVYTSALPMTNPDHPELKFVEANRIKTSKRDEFLNQIIKDKNLQLIAVAGTHGKSTTTAMAVWLLKQLGMPVSYCLGAKLSFSELGAYESESKYFVYEADEFDRNFLSFYPEIALISGIDWDHPDIYPTRESYYSAFNEFLSQSSLGVIWHDDAKKLALSTDPSRKILDSKDPEIERQITLQGSVNRLNAWLVAQGLAHIVNTPHHKIVDILNNFPGLSRRFEQIVPGLYTDYAHTPPKIRGALQTAQESAGKNVVVVYEGLHNSRQHFIKEQLSTLFEDIKKLYIVPSYLAREDKSLKILEPSDIKDLLSQATQAHATAVDCLDDSLKQKIVKHLEAGDLVLCLTAGGANSLDEWLRQKFSF